jgi:hypothetical protein
MTRHIQIIPICLFLSLQTTFGQVTMDSSSHIWTNYCDSTVSKNSIGHKVKIWFENGCIDCDDFKLQNGDIGLVVDIYSPFPDQKIYLLNFNDTLVKFDCGYLCDTSWLDLDKASEKFDFEQKARQEKYANDCKFKITDINGSWNRAGLYNIDTISESFACRLLDSGVDTIMLAKYIYDNGSSPYESAFVFWQKQGEMFLKSFYNNAEQLPTEQETISFDWRKISNYYYKNKLDTVSTYPVTRYYQSHDMGLVIMFYSPGIDFFCDRLPNYVFSKSKKHVKSTFWNLVFDELSDKIIYNYHIKK